MTQSFADPGVPGGNGGGGATRTATVNLDANVSGFTAGMGDAAASAGLLSRGIDGVQQRMTGLNKWAGKKLFHFAASDFAVLTGASADAATFEKQLSTLAATAVVTGTSMSGIKNGVEAAFTKFPVSRGAVVDLTEAITNLGVTSVKDIGSLTQTFIKLGAATGEPMNQLASGLIQLSRLMGNTGATQIGNYANSLLTVSKNAGVSASGVLSFAQAIAPIARQAGISEGAVLGISTAFTKAGADGLIAANTFNSMVSDITQATATGSPDLAKYANLIGVSVEKFKGMDKTNAMVDILQAISKEGPQSLAVLSSLGIESTRAQAAIAAVTQSGDLRDQVNSAMGAQGNQTNLNKGSQAAMGGLADSMINVRNQFTQFGTEIGTTFLTPLTLIGNVVVKVTSNLNALIKPFAPIIAGMAAIAGAGAGIGSIALTAAGAIGAYALIRNVRQSGAVSAFRGGLNANAAGATVAGGPMDRYTSGQMGFVQRRLYEGGLGARNAMGRMGFSDPATGGSTSPWRQGSTWRNALIAGPMNGMRMLSGANQQFLQGNMGGTRGVQLPMAQRLNLWGSSLQGRSALDVAGSSAASLARQAGATARATAGVGMQLGGRVLNAGWRLAGPSVLGALVGGVSGVPGGGRMLNAGIRNAPTGGIKDEAANTRAEFGKLSASISSASKGMVGFKDGLGSIAGASKDVAISLTRLSGTLAGAGVGQAVKGIGATVSGAVKGIGAVGGIAARAAFSLPGMAAILGMQKINALDNKDQSAGDVDKFLNPIQKYNDMLGTTTTNLASFNAGLIEGAAAITPTKTMAQAATVGAGDQSNAPNKAKNAVFGDVMDQFKSGDKAQGLASTLASMPISDPKQLQAAKEDMFAAGASKDDVAKALKIYMKAGGPNAISGVQSTGQTWANLGIAAANTEGNGPNWGGDMSKSVSGGHILASLLSGVDSQRISDEQTVGGGFAQQKALQSYATGLAPLAGNLSLGSKNQQTTSAKALADAMHTITGGDKGDYQDYLLAHKGDAGKTDASQQAFIVKALGQTKQGSQWEKALTAGGGTLDMADVAKKLSSMASTSDDSSFNGILRRTGGQLGSFAATDKTVQSAIGANQANTGVVDQSIQKLADMATKAGGGLNGAAAELSKFQGAIGDNTAVLYKQVTAAQALVVQQEAYKAPFQTRGATFTNTVQAYQGATQAYYNTPTSKRTDEQYQFMKTQKDNYETGLANQQSYLQTMYQTAQSYGIQMTRGQEDENLQVLRSQAAFHLQMANAQTDFLTQRNRTEQDHDTQMANQVATSAQTIYNPYQRVQSEYTTDAETVLQNLKEQNARINQQSAQVSKLHKEGLSTSTIQTLDLSNPANQQQTAELADQLKNSPKLIAQLNAEALKRTKGTKELTQSPFSLAFAQGEADYKKQLDRSQADYDLATSRAVTAQQLSLSYMAADYAKTVSRAGEDLTTAMKEVTGNFGNMYDKTMSQVAKSVQKFSPMAAAQMKKDLGDLVNTFPFLKGGDASSYGGGAAGLPGTKTNPLTQAMTVGVNSKGVVGEYSDSGKFTALQGPYDKSKLPVIASPTSVPAPAYTQHSLGGIATSVQPTGTWGEAGPEALIPLNQRGQDFMAGLIARAMGQSMTMAGGHAPISQSSITDASTNFTGAVTVLSQDTTAFANQMKAKARLARLSSPVRH